MTTYRFVIVMCDCCGEEADAPGRDATEARRFARGTGWVTSLPQGRDKCLGCGTHREPCKPDALPSWAS